MDNTQEMEIMNLFLKFGMNVITIAKKYQAKFGQEFDKCILACWCSTFKTLYEEDAKLQVLNILQVIAEGDLIDIMKTTDKLENKVKK